MQVDSLDRTAAIAFSVFHLLITVLLSWHAQAAANRRVLSVLNWKYNLTSITHGISYKGMNKSSVNMPNVADGSKNIKSHCAWWHLELQRGRDSQKQV